ncbi:MAG: hypothetical protein M3R07_11945, partial [Gemmatimonadota bacterium]|nr:hypothetical protein [Gemmatimonadota bacterium]
AERFERVSDVLGTRKKKPRFDAVLTITTDRVAEAQKMVETVLEEKSRRWRLDEIETHVGKPSEIYYLLRLKKSVVRDELLTAIRAGAGDRIQTADLESRDGVEEEVGIST